MDTEQKKWRLWYWIPITYFVAGLVWVWIILEFVSDDYSHVGPFTWLLWTIPLFPSGLFSFYMYIAGLHYGSLVPAKQSLVPVLIVNALALLVALLIVMKWWGNRG